MTPVLGNLLLAAAREPLSTSSERFYSNFLGDGVRAVSAARLREALDRGVGEVARASGVGAELVTGALPRDEIALRLASLHEHHQRTLAALRPGELTVTAFHQPAGKVSPATHMMDISAHFSRDKAIAEPLRALASEVAAWEELLGMCATAVREHPGIAARYERTQRLRLLARRGLAVGIAGAGLAVLGAGWAAHLRAEATARARAARAEAAYARTLRVDAALSGPDPCVQLDAADLGALTADQRARLTSRGVECERARARAAETERCAALVAAVTAGSSAIPAEFSRDAALLGRIAARALSPEDLRIDALPCDGLAPAFVEAALQSPDAFGKSMGPSAKVAALLEHATLPPRLAATIAFRAELAANAAIRSGVTADLEGATRLCAMKQRAGLAVGMGCRVLSARQDPAP
ncbi:MAG: hypothetical protein IT374_04420 [Polyangiaceae bacterium]|nr:hypothetical protein [Polyangiaceae bacterium]